MCGIAGCFGIDSSVNINMYNKMRRRGPNNFSYYKDDNFTLFHSRLSIIDTSENANQPFIDDTYVFAYNGELYNYKEITNKYNYSKELSKCDGRVFFSLLKQQGLILGLNEADGMFALVYYNKKTKELTLARDCFGEKPLFVYTGERDKIYFASQINYLMTMVGKQFDINYNMVNNYLFSGYRSLFKDCNQTFFKDVYAVEPGTYLTFTIKNNKIKRSVNTFFNPVNCLNKQKPFEIDSLKKQIEYIVETRLRSDVPLAFCMSGGVDSNLLITTAKRIFDYDVHGFTIGNSNSRYDESKVVNKVVDKLSIKHTYVNIDKNESFINNLKTIIYNNCSPLVSISYYLHWLLLKTISSYGYKVTVSGTGGDELFSGYYDHYLYHIAQVKDRNKAISSWENNIAPYVRNRTFKDPILFVNHPDYREYLYPNRKYLDLSLINKPEYFYERWFIEDILKNRMVNELLYETVPPILHDDDLNSMFFSVENRSPLLQKDLFKIAMSVDSNDYIVDGVAKYPLRSVFHQIAPDIAKEIPIKKTGFNASLFDICPSYKNYLFSSNSPLWDIVDKELLMQEDYISEKDSMFLFNLLNMKLFLEIF